jgi:hypothetical protein
MARLSKLWRKKKHKKEILFLIIRRIYYLSFFPFGINLLQNLFNLKKKYNLPVVKIVSLIRKMLRFSENLIWGREDSTQVKSEGIWLKRKKREWVGVIQEERRAHGKSKSAQQPNQVALIRYYYYYENVKQCSRCNG